MFLPDLSRRRAVPELMDSPDLEPERHASALRALARVNVLSLTAQRVWKRVEGLAATGHVPVRVLDLACGGGDVAVAVARRARRSGLSVEVHGCDRSSFALDQAREHAVQKGVPVRFFKLDVLDAPIPTGFDLICSSLFLHHLTADQGETVLRSMAVACRNLLVQDLVRSRFGYALAVVTLRATTRSDVARIDGERSVRSAFTVPEVREMARRAGLAGARVGRCWPQRLELTWQAPSGSER
jgi:SAM-dependent methyltransferase